MTRYTTTFDDFRCGHCGNHVSVAHILSGVNNRNHCPYCLWSCHLDLYSAGDRLSACKGKMKPIGLTMKKSRNKYQIKFRGELMLIHECTDCNTLSINRIAADDDPDTIMEIFYSSLSNVICLEEQCRSFGIQLLKDENAVSLQLFGENERMLV